MTNHPNRGKRRIETENYYIDYRYRPGAIGDESSLDNGAVVRVAARTITAANKRVVALQADPRIQWAKIVGGHAKRRSTSSY